MRVKIRMVEVTMKQPDKRVDTMASRGKTCHLPATDEGWYTIAHVACGATLYGRHIKHIHSYLDAYGV